MTDIIRYLRICQEFVNICFDFFLRRKQFGTGTVCFIVKIEIPYHAYHGEMEFQQYQLSSLKEEQKQLLFLTNVRDTLLKVEAISHER